ncbi:MAG: hypothetical protein HYX89_05100 [Chloroflexi bacterium]|nr:hypothetical protein [Chloroflexota bacterium]
MPTATFCSAAFVHLGRSEARALGVPALPIVVVPHPMDILKPEVVRQIAALVADSVAYALTTPRDVLEAEYGQEKAVVRGVRTLPG